MLFTKLKIVAAVLLVLSVFGLRSTKLAFRAAAAEQIKADEIRSKPTKSQTAGPKVDVKPQGVKLGRGPADYKKIFKNVLDVVSEDFEIIVYSNQYDGRIEAISPIPPAEKVAATGPSLERRAMARIDPVEEGGYSISVVVHIGASGEAGWKTMGRDAKIEQTILKRLGAKDQGKRK